MSKHPIDDLFARQLKDHRVKPERASWEELHRRMNAKEERTSPFVWWSAVAASVGVILLASWLWSSRESGKERIVAGRIVTQAPQVSTPAKTIEPITTGRETVEGPTITYRQSEVQSTARQNRTHHKSPASKSQTAEKSPETDVAVLPVSSEDILKAETQMADVASSVPERTLIVRIAAPNIEKTELTAENEPTTTDLAETEESQPRKRRFRLGRVLRQFNKLKAGEPVEWEEVGVQPGVLMARASEKVQEGKEKISDSYDNLRFNTFRKNSNNK
jgi:hypothetical protein